MLCPYLRLVERHLLGRIRCVQLPPKRCRVVPVSCGGSAHTPCWWCARCVTFSALGCSDRRPEGSGHQCGEAGCSQEDCCSNKCSQWQYGLPDRNTGCQTDDGRRTKDPFDQTGCRNETEGGDCTAETCCTYTCDSWSGTCTAGERNRAGHVTCNNATDCEDKCCQFFCGELPDLVCPAGWTKSDDRHMCGSPRWDQPGGDQPGGDQIRTSGTCGLGDCCMKNCDSFSGSCPSGTVLDRYDHDRCMWHTGIDAASCTNDQKCCKRRCALNFEGTCPDGSSLRDETCNLGGDNDRCDDADRCCEWRCPLNFEGTCPDGSSIRDETCNPGGDIDAGCDDADRCCGVTYDDDDHDDDDDDDDDADVPYTHGDAAPSVSSKTDTSYAFSFRLFEDEECQTDDGNMNAGAGGPCVPMPALLTAMLAPPQHTHTHTHTPTPTSNTQRFPFASK